MPLSKRVKVDRFDDRLAAVRRQYKGASKVSEDLRRQVEEQVRDVSWYEFYYKYFWRGGKLCASSGRNALMVTPSLSSDCAWVEHDKHDVYARCCVVAFWRLMPTERRYKMIESAGFD